jgi:hypothetical protein
MGEDDCPSEVSDPILLRTGASAALSATRPPRLGWRPMDGSA